MNTNRFFPLWLHIVFATGAIGMAAGLHKVDPIDIVKAYTATGFAVGIGITALLRIFKELFD